MKIGLISDIHANLEALECSLRRLDRERVDVIYCLGDIVGYGPNPNECVEVVQKNCKLSLLGNHDDMALNESRPEHFNNHARKAMEWTRRQLGENARQYLADCPYYAQENGLYLVHASPKSPADWAYVASLDDAVEAFEWFAEDYCIIGHTHRPMMALQQSEQEFCILESEQWVLEGKERILVNTGSVGQPRDLDPRISFGIIDTKEKEVRLIRQDYDFHITQAKMEDAGLPEFLIHRLTRGA